MIGRKKWFDAGSKGMVQCWVEGDGSILGQRVDSFMVAPKFLAAKN